MCPLNHTLGAGKLSLSCCAAGLLPILRNGVQCSHMQTRRVYIVNAGLLQIWLSKGG